MKKAAAAPTFNVGKELHDTVCQTLTGLHLHLSVVAGKMRKTCPDCSGDLDELQKLVERARSELQGVVKKIPQ